MPCSNASDSFALHGAVACRPDDTKQQMRADQKPTHKLGEVCATSIFCPVPLNFLEKGNLYLFPCGVIAAVDVDVIA